MERRTRSYARSRISDKKFRQLRHVSCTEIHRKVAPQLTGLGCKAVTVILLKIRRRIAEQCERASSLGGGVEVGESYFGARKEFEAGPVAGPAVRPSPLDS
jgi:transposase